MKKPKAADDLNKINDNSEPLSVDSLEQCNVERLNFETLLTEIAARFVNLPIDQIDTAIKDSQRIICEYLRIDRSIIWHIVQTDPMVVVLSHGHNVQGDWLPGSPFKPGEHIPWLIEQILQGETVLIGPEKDLPRIAEKDVEVISQWGVKSVLVLPLSVGGKVIGALSFGRLRSEEAWSDGITKRLELIAQLFSNALARKQSEETLQFQLRCEHLLNELTTRFINLPANQIDTEIEYAQRMICESLDIDMSVLWQWVDKAPPFMTVTHVHSPPGGPERPDRMDSREVFPWGLKRVLEGELFEIHTEKLPPEAARDRETRRFYGAESSIVIPLSVRAGKIIGALSFDILGEDREWPEQVVKVLGLFAQIFTNALARKQADLKLRESETRLNMTTNAARVGLWVLEIDTGDIWISDRAIEIFQKGKDEPIDYSRFIEMVHPNDRKRANKALHKSIRSDTELSFEYRIVLPDKSIRWVAVNGKRSLKETGEPDRLMGVVIDISERKRMEVKLQSRLKEIGRLKEKLEKENLYLREEIENTKVPRGIVARSPEMRLALAQAEKVADTNATVLIEGETGTGKEMLARMVHRLSHRKNLPLVTVNCASLPPALIESELFGREKGAYTGAMIRMAGRFEVADGGTLFLDEIGELPFEVQAKLLRALEEGCFERLGSTHSIKVDVRIIAATNQNLEKLVATGKFRKDLYYRLNVFPINLPPLRKRAEDIPPLFWNFIRQNEKKLGKRIDNVPHHNIKALQQYEWPGNIRELRNVVERAMILCSGRTLELPPLKGQAEKANHSGHKLEEVERCHIEDVLEKTGWRISGKGGAAEVLGLKRTTLNARIKKLGIQRP